MSNIFGHLWAKNVTITSKLAVAYNKLAHYKEVTA